MWNPFKRKPKRKPAAKRVVVPNMLEKSKMQIRIGYTQYVLDSKHAIALANILSTAEIYEAKYHSELNVKNHEDKYTHHIYTCDQKFQFEIITDDYYKMCKLAGKPEK